MKGAIKQQVIAFFLFHKLFKNFKRLPNWFAHLKISTLKAATQRKKTINTVDLHLDFFVCSPAEFQIKRKVITGQSLKDMQFFEPSSNSPWQRSLNRNDS